MTQVMFGRALSLRLVLIAAIMVLASAHVVGTAPPAAAQGTATIEITNIDADTGQPAPFTRFQVTSENGTVYGPLETDLSGYVAFSVTVDPQGTSFTVVEETPPACATAPEPQTTDPLQAGASTSLSFTTQDNPGCGLGTVALYAMACPDGFTGPADDYAPWEQGCTGTSDGTGFTLTSVATDETWNPTAGAYGIAGRAPVVGLPAGDYTFQQNGESPAAVFCLVYDTSNYATSPAPSSVLPVTMTDGVGTISLNGNRVSCDLFTVPGGAPVQPATTETPDVQPAAGATLDIHLAACPPGYLAGDTIYGDCHGNGIAGQPVQVSADNGFAGTIATALLESPGPGVASFTGLADGLYTVTTSVPENTTVFVYCTDAGNNQIPASFDDTTHSLSVALASGDAITCDWYELPQGEVQPAQGSSSIEVHALLCPNGTNPDGNLYDSCHANGMAGVTFSVTGPDGYTGQQTTTLPAVPGPGVALFPDLTAGNYTVTQENVDPDSIVTMYCSLADAEDVVPFQQMDAGTISFDLPDETGVVCDFYTIPPPDLASDLLVTKYSCPIGMDADLNTPLSTFQQNCTELTDGVDFTLAPLGQQGAVRTTGSAGTGSVLFEGLPTGNFSLTEDIPGDFNTPYAFCGPDSGELTPYTWIHGGNPLAIDASQGDYACLWFNIPADAGQPSTISVTKYLCPQGTTGSYRSRCGSSPLSGATFVLDGPGQYESQVVTGADGGAWWGELSSGDYTLTEIPPAGVNVAVYVVSCEAGGQDFETTYDDRNGMRIELALPAGADVTCNWYNIPPSAPTVTPNQPQGSITVHKFLCQGKSVNAYNWDADCAAETASVGFSLKTSDGRPIAVGSTDNKGVLKFTGLANGAYSLDETTGDWCHAEADRVDSAGNVLVNNGGNTDVYIYNCSLKQVGTLPSTGTGPAATAPAADFDAAKLWQLMLAALVTLGIALATRLQLKRVALRSTDTPDEAFRAGGEEVSS